MLEKDIAHTTYILVQRRLAFPYEVDMLRILYDEKLLRILYDEKLLRKRFAVKLSRALSSSLVVLAIELGGAAE